MHSKIDSSEIMINNKAEGVIDTFLESTLNRYQLDWKHQSELVILSLTVFICCIINLFYYGLNVVNHI